ncbi:MAG: transposase [Methylococcales bacterium]|nr:transposase [Methylococcales bacterium]
MADHPIGHPPYELELYAGLSSLSGTGWHVFFTANLLERWLDTLVRHIDILREAVRKTRRERPFHIDAWLMLPDHIHCIWTLPPGDDDSSNRRTIKIRFVQSLPQTVAIQSSNCKS